METEWQFEARDLQVVRDWLRSQPPQAVLSFEDRGTATQHDTYLDTADWTVHRAGYALRVRRRDDGSEATMKATTRQTRGPVSREEYNQSLADGATSLLAGEGPVSGRLRLLLADGRLLRELFRVETRRQSFLVRRRDEVLATLSLDDCLVFGREAPVPLLRVEIEEERRGGLEAIDHFVEALREACDLVPAQESKFESGLHAAELAPDAAPDLGPAELSDDLSAGDYALAILRRFAGEILVHEPGSRLGEDPEDLHDMRVATRRSRAAMAVLEEALDPSFQELRDELGWLGSVLGEVRDRDVRLASLEAALEDADWQGANATNALISYTVEERSAARRRLLEAVQSERYRSLMEKLSISLRGPQQMGPAAQQPVRAHARRVLRREYKRFDKAASSLETASPDADYHRARRRLRRMRYAAEFFHQLYGRQAKNAAESMTRGQDLLGAYQDSNVANEWLRGVVRRHSTELTADSLVHIGEMLERNRVQMGQLRQDWPSAYKEIRSAWKSLRKSLKPDSKVKDEGEGPAESTRRPRARQGLLALFRRLRPI